MNKYKFLSFEQAKEYVLQLKLKSTNEWRKYCKSGQKPSNIPLNPDKTYLNKGWVNWVDWLGSDNKPNTNFHLKLDREMIKQVMEERFRKIVEDKGGVIIEGEYKNDKSRFIIECNKGHQWKPSCSNIFNGSWCRKCFNEEKAGKHFILKDGLEQASKIAIERGGKCLSTEYINSMIPLQFECKNGHQWSTNISDLKKGSWCPTCGTGIKERTCRNIFEQITSKSFPKKRPSWLLNTRNKQMELDGFCEELSLAFEYHGEYHYVQNKHFQRDEETLERRQLDDRTKVELCEKNNVNLIIIPYTVKLEEFKDFIFEKLTELNLPIKLNENIIDTYVPSNELEELHKLAEKKGGKCLSKVYLGSNVKHEFECSKGHTWSSKPSNIKTKTWCPLCGNDRIGDAIRKYDVDDMRALAKEKNGLFLSPTFKNVNERYLWQCENGHQWYTTPMEIKRGTWCKKCWMSKSKKNRKKH